MAQRSGVVCAWHAQCSCGWSSGGHFGKGSREEAWKEYRMHKEKCDEAFMARRAAEKACGERRLSHADAAAGYGSL